jgi:ABC-type glutathione transport system ATPase component
MPTLVMDGATTRDAISGSDDVAVVHDIDLTIDDGEIVALVGPSGSGKTSPRSATSSADAASPRSSSPTTNASPATPTARPTSSTAN